MLTREQFMYLKVAEECAEVIHRVSKIMQYGPDEQQEGYPCNRDRLQFEVDDLLSTLYLCSVVQLLEFPDSTDDPTFLRKVADKKARIEHFATRAVACGQVEG